MLISAAAGMVVLALCACAGPTGSGTGTPDPDGGPTFAPPTQTPPSSEAPDEKVGPRKRTTGLNAPWSVVFVGNTPLVSERDSGRILELADDGSKRTVARLDDVVHGGEGGLLGLAVSSGAGADAGSTTTDAEPGRDYLYAYSTGANGNRVQRFPLRGAPGALELGEPKTIIDGLPSALQHNGGRIAFGPDGMLYVTVGDAGQPGLAQDLDSLGGKILRLTPGGKVPKGNPFPGSPVYSYGHRNPQGIAWADDGTMYASEFGQDTWDELNRITPGGDYGWPIVEGIAGDARFVDPLQQWSPAEASPSGIAIAHGRIYMANLRGQRLRAVPLAHLDRSKDYFVGKLGRIRDVTATPDGSLWLLTNNTDGRLAPKKGDDRFMDTGIL